MIVKIITELGPWTWWIIGFTFLALEIFAPGVFFLWIGLAALAVGTHALIVPLGWHIQIIIFAVLALLFAVLGRRFYGVHSKRQDNELLNERGKQFVGRSYKLAEPISGGRGRLKVGDTFWLIEADEDLAAGTDVIVTDADGSLLQVARAI